MWGGGGGCVLFWVFCCNFFFLFFVPLVVWVFLGFIGFCCCFFGEDCIYLFIFNYGYFSTAGLVF